MCYAKSEWFNGWPVALRGPTGHLCRRRSSLCSNLRHRGIFLDINVISCTICQVRSCNHEFFCRPLLASGLFVISDESSSWPRQASLAAWQLTGSTSRVIPAVPACSISPPHDLDGLIWLTFTALTVTLWQTAHSLFLLLIPNSFRKHSNSPRLFHCVCVCVFL